MRFISLSSDFGVQTNGIGAMRGVILSICPDANIIDLMHGIPSFDISVGARAMESIQSLPVGCHVCVVDPGVGTKRRSVIIRTGRGDYLIGPDNGVLMPCTRVLGGIRKIVEITNDRYMNKPVSAIFHGRDIFSAAAAHLSKGVGMEKFGKNLKEKDLVPAPYDEAIVKGKSISGQLISSNKFGSFHMNGMGKQLEEIGAELGDILILQAGKKKIRVRYTRTFGEVAKGKPVVLKDEYGRIELAVNQGSFKDKYRLKIGQKVSLKI